MIVSIHQPDYIPYLGLFYKVSKSDVFVFLDDAQYSNDNVHNWNRIKTPQGECRLKIPVVQHFGDLINQVKPNFQLKWREKHLKTIEMNYARAPYFKEYFPVFSDLLMADYNNLADLNVAINSWMFKQFGFKVKLYRTSGMQIDTVREERVIDICVKLGGTKYISGNGARAYQVEEHFTSCGVQLEYTDYQPIEYPQLWMKQCGFLKNMSALDYVFNCGFDWKQVAEKVNAYSHGNR